MKFFLVLTISCILTIGAFAQKSDIKFGVKAGVNLSKFVLSGSDYTQENKDEVKYTTSFHVSGLVDLPISNSLWLQPGLSLTNKGAEARVLVTDANTMTQTKITESNTIMYLEVPVNLVFKTKGVYFGMGPYAAFALAGKYKEETVTTSGSQSSTTKDTGDLHFGSDAAKDNYKSTDFGFNFLGGYQLKNGLNIGANYGLGLVNLEPDNNPKNKQTNSVISFSVGFMF